ncbi:MAG: hypothetical protein K2J89_07115, partial [Clostridia bacterium]|nr:hypothetical protein [Clostridia bacterium]
MDIRKRRIRGYFALSALIIILSLCLAMALPSVSAVAPSEVANAAATPGTASVLNLNQNGVYTDNFSSVITGGQNEYIYFGTNVTSNTENEPGYNNTHTGAIKWRVLSGNDTKYSNGNMLLWADYQLGTANYNANYNNPNYAYYGTSMIRAKLNGGTYLSNVSNTTTVPTLDQTVLVANSWLYKLFVPNERDSIVTANSIESKCFGYISDTYATTGIVGTGSGQYNATNVNNVAGTYASVSGTSVIETIPAGESLFLLDYYDINNVDYGFSDNGTTYANKINPSWTPSSAGYPGYYDNGNNGSITADCLKFSDDIAIYYWLRPVGRYSTEWSYAMRVTSAGQVAHSRVSSTYGVRPALNFDSSNVIYATAASVASNGDTFASVSSLSADSDKPTYKVYLKTSNYVNYNEQTSGAPIISSTDSKVTVSKAGQSGSAVILLADKSGSGNVVYQATASFNNGVATATLPSGINASDYSVTVLFVNGSARGGEYAESITGSYTITSPLSIPEAISIDYNGNVHTLDTLKNELNLDWYNSKYADTSAVKVEYLTSTGSVLSSSDYPKNAGKYQIRLTIVDTANYQWPDKETDSNLYRTIDFEINQIEMAYPSITGAKSKPYSGGNDVRFQLDGFDPNSMELSWKESYDGVGISTTTPPYSVSAQTVGKYELVATIKPDQAINYKFSSTPKIEVEVTPAQLVIEKIVASGGGSNSAFSISEGTASISVDIFVDVNGAPLGSDVVPITIYIPYGSSDIDVSQGISLDASTLPSTSYQVTNQQIINLGSLFEGNYSFDVKTTDKNYTVSLKNAATLTVLPAGQRTNILWKLYEGNSERSNYRTVTELNETGVKPLNGGNLTYTGVEFRLEVELPNGYTLDGGYTVEKISGQGSILGQDAGTYRTTIKLAENNQEYSIEWTIDKAVIDLSNVKWKYDGKLPYNGGAEVKAELEEGSIPEQLTATYGGSLGGTSVGGSDGSGTVSVTFTLKEGYRENYVLPIQGDTDSYVGSNFEWSKAWEIVPATIKLEWVDSEAEDEEGNAFTVKKLADTTVDGIVEYVYYETDSNGNVKEPKVEVKLEDIRVSATERKYYVAV